MPEIREIKRRRTNKHKLHNNKKLSKKNKIIKYEGEEDNIENINDNDPSNLKRKLKTLIDKKLNNNKKLKLDLRHMANPTKNVDSGIANTELELYDPQLKALYNNTEINNNNEIITNNKDEQYNPNFKATQNNYLTDEQKYKLYMSHITDQFGRYYKNIGQFNKPYSNYYGDAANMTTQYQNPLLYQNDQGQWVNAYVQNNPINPNGYNASAYNTNSYINNQRWQPSNGYNEEALEWKRKFELEKDEKKKLADKVNSMTQEQKQWFSNKVFKWMENRGIVGAWTFIEHGIAVLMTAILGGGLQAIIGLLPFGPFTQVLSTMLVWRTPLLRLGNFISEETIRDASWMNLASGWFINTWVQNVYNYYHNGQAEANGNILSTVGNFLSSVWDGIKNACSSFWNYMSSWFGAPPQGSPGHLRGSQPGQVNNSSSGVPNNGNTASTTTTTTNTSTTANNNNNNNNTCPNPDAYCPVPRSPFGPPQQEYRSAGIINKKRIIYY